MNKFFLIGIPNCGKSTLGRRVADVLRLPFFDTDVMACEKLGTRHVLDQIRASINGSVEAAQRKVIDELVALDSAAIIATGAEIALIPRCAALLRKEGTVIHVIREPEMILTDMQNNGGSKWVMRDRDNGEEIVMREQAVKLYAQEISQYNALADVIFENNESEDAGVEKLIALIGERHSLSK
jgi:shikimate kinase